MLVGAEIELNFFIVAGIQLCLDLHRAVLGFILETG